MHKNAVIVNKYKHHIDKSGTKGVKVFKDCL